MTKTVCIIAKTQNILVRITGILIRFGVILQSMSVETNKESAMYTILITVKCEDSVIENIKKLINKQIDVVSVHYVS